MPSWKKVLISGSDAALNTLIVTNGITGSLFGTASYATQALSASWAPAATNAFIQNGNSFGTTALLGTNDNQSLALETNGTTRMFISSSGDIGIGKIIPNAKLDVNGNTAITGSLRVQGAITSSQDIQVNGIDIGNGGRVTSVLVGAGALQNNTTGTSNVAIGSQALFTSSIASGLVAIGANTLRLNTVGSANTAVGTNALQANTTGNNNTAIGREALASSSLGFNNTANGRNALFQNTTGNSNSAIGAFALANNLVGSGNIAIGVSASLSTTGNSNIVIGFSADTQAAANNNSIVIGSGSVGLGSNTTVIGNSSTTATAIYGDLLVGQTADNGTDKFQVTGTSNLNGNTRVTGSLTVTNGITGSLFGTASWAVSASWAPTPDTAATASFVTASNVYGPFGSNSIISASFAISSSRAVTSSFALTSSYAINQTISGSINNVDYIDFNTGSAEPAWKSGRVYWNNTDGALSVYNAEADISLQVGQENWVRVRNATGVLIPNGTAVRLIGSHGDSPKVVLAQSIQVSGSATRDNQILGIATHDIEINTFGYITTTGLVKGVNTSAFADGDRLYVSSSAGKLTNILPVAPYEIIPAGVVVKASPGGSGIIYADPYQPMDFTDLSSVEIGDYTYGDIFTYIKSGSTGVWRHTNQLSGSYGITGSLNVTQGITGSLFGTASYALTSSFLTSNTNAFIQNGNSFGTTALLGTNDNQSLAIETSGSTRMFISSSGNVGIGTTSPLSKFQVRAKIDQNLRVSLGTTLEVNSINDADSAYTPITFRASTYNFANGDVGIGTTTPNAKLDVSGSAIITGSLIVTNGITGSLLGTASYATQALSASYAPYQVTSSYALTASYAPSYLPLTGGTINGNVIVNGTASIAFLNVQFESASVIYSSGSNVFGDATNDTQTLNGTVLVSGSQQITGSLDVNGGITGSLFGTASWAFSASFVNASTTNAFIQNGNSFGTLALLGTNDNQSLAIETSGSTRMFISSSGNVGIGTTSPGAKLHIASPNMGPIDTFLVESTAGNGAFAIKGASTANYVYQTFYQGTSGKFEIGIIPTTSDFYINPNVQTGPTGAAIYIKKSDGNVGIGLTSPTAPLDTNGVRIGRNFEITGRATVRLDSNTSTYPADVLFGHTAAANQTGWTGVHWSLSSRADNDSNKFYIYRGGGNPGGSGEEVIMALQPNGNVGIGETGPSRKLEVAGDVGLRASALGSAATQILVTSADPASTTRTVQTRTPGQLLSDIGAQAALTNPVTGTGANQRVALWSGTTTQNSSANLTFDGTTLAVGGGASTTGNVVVGASAYLASGNYIYFDLGVTNDYAIRKTSTSLAFSSAGNFTFNRNVDITGTLTATVKSFIIDHPTKEGKKLQYGVLEGPEHSVYVRGKLTNNNTITLPDHWTGLVHEDTITVNLTPIGKRQDLWVETVTDTSITVGSDNEINCFYTVFAERKDIEKLVTEFDK